MSLNFLKFEEIPIQIVRVPFLRKMTVKMEPHRPVLLKIGLLTSQRTILDFLETQKVWIQKTRAQMLEIEEKTPQLTLREGASFLYQGKMYPLRIHLTLKNKAIFFLHDHDQEVLPMLYLPQNLWAKHRNDLIYPWNDLVREAYKERAVTHLQQIVSYWSQKMDLHPSQLQFRSQKTRWGSCSSRKTLSFNWKLILFPREVIDYVVIHELAHLKYMNHSKDFWSLVAQYSPNYKEQTQFLRKNFYWSTFLS